MIANKVSLAQFPRIRNGRCCWLGDASHDHDITKTMMGDEPLTEDAQTVAPLAHMDALPPGTMLGEFELQGLLGVGGFGMVYRGYDHSLHRPVAIKEYMPSSLVGRATGMQVSARSTADTQPFLTGLASFMAEARLLAQFDHPSLVKVYRVWEENNTAYMAMPLYSGITLKAARSAMSGPPPEDWLRAVLWSILEALKVLHANGTLHRDVSPDNIFLQDIGPPVLLDLGAARRALIDSSRKHTAILKVNYAPIEQYADAHDMQEGPWTDLYALAAVTHGCLCNEAPLPSTFRVVRDRMPPIASVAKTVETHFGQSYSSAFVRAIDHALAIQPSKRPKDAEAFAREMRLRTPKHMDRFDWRAQLGDKVTLGGGKEGPSEQAHLPTRPHNPGARTQPASRTGRVPASMRRPGVWIGLAVIAVLALAVAGYYGSWLDSTESSGVAAALPTAMPTPTSPPLPAPIAVVETPPPVTVPAQPAISQVLKPSSVGDNRGKPVSVPVPVKPHGTAPAPKVRAAGGDSHPKPQPESRLLCADSNVLTRSMCVYRECQKPEFADLPVCIEDRKRWEKRDKERLP